MASARSSWGGVARRGGLAALLGAAGCQAGAQVEPPAVAPSLAAPVQTPGRIELKELPLKPRLTVITREGDPSPAIVGVVLTDLGSAASTALAAIVEARLKAAGFEVDTRADRDAFRVRLLVADPARAAGFLSALAGAMARPVAAGAPELSLAAQRLLSLRRNPLDAADLEPVVGCTGALGVPADTALPDATSPVGARQIEGWRAASLHAGHLSLASVGPTAFGAQVVSALEKTTGFPLAPPADAPLAWPAADATVVYSAPNVERNGAKITLAVRVSDPTAAAAAAERLGTPESPLASRLRQLQSPWRLAEVVGVAKARGGCLAVTLEAGPLSTGHALEPGAGLAAAMARREMTTELAAGPNAGVAARQVLGAADPREAGARGAWWALAGAVPGAPARWVTALGIAPAHESAGAARVAARDVGAPRATAAALATEIDRALAAHPKAERRTAAEHGQGELWVLVGSPCGAAEEGTNDAGLGALATLGAIESRRRRGDVALEPWITAEGLGVIAHASARDDRETAGELARRVGDAAARAVLAPELVPEAVGLARSSHLTHLERSFGRRGGALELFASAAAPDHPSWLDPFGVFGRVSGASLDALRLRAQALAEGPIRVAVLGNTDPAQAMAAADAVDRWLNPTSAPRSCRAGSPVAPRAGKLEVHLHESTLSEAVVGAAVPPPGAAGRELAELTAAALDGPEGMGQAALSRLAATASARLAGGARAPVLVVEVRAPEEGISPAASEIRGLLLRLGGSASEADLGRAFSAAERREREARVDPRRRLVDLWTGRRPFPSQKPSLSAWRSFLGATFRESTVMLAEARGD